MARKKVEPREKLFLQALEEMSKEKGIDNEITIDAIQYAFVVAITKKLDDEYQVFKKPNAKKASNKVKLSDALVRTVVDLENGTISVYHQHKVVADDDVQDDYIEIGLSDAQKIQPELNIGDYLEEPFDFLNKFTKGDVDRFVSAFKQRISKAETDSLLAAFSSKIGEIVTGSVEKADSHCVIVNLGRTSATLFQKDLIGKEKYKPGDSIKVYVAGIGKGNKNGGSLIQISRSHPGFLRKLFEQEVHEIYDQTVIIKDVARIAGVRSKVAVYSNDPNVDPSGACIGQSGNRIQAIVSQLGNARDSKEKIDVVTYSPNIGLYLQECLKPGEMVGAVINEENNSVTVITRDGTSSLAIGQKGCNVRLTKMLTKFSDIQVIDEAEALERGIETYKTIDEFTIEAREEEKKKYREESIKAQGRDVKEFLKTEIKEDLFTKDELDDEEITEELPEEENVTEAPTVEEPVVEEKPVEVVTPKKPKYEIPDQPTEVKTTTTLESLEKSLEEEKEKETKKAFSKSKKKKEESFAKDDDKEVIKKESVKMSIYTEDELADFDDELDEEYDDDEDYSEYDSDEYYDE
ncbi:MAG: transcription termination factor NusA [Candidatus Onthovivens sp.]|nr:transcription termination factor NusA [Candidatus Onthovivens sp.]